MSSKEGSMPANGDSIFLTRNKLKKRARALSVDAFVHSYPQPGLLVEPTSVEAIEHESTQGMDHSGVQLLTVAAQGVGVLRYLNRIGFVRKRPGNPYAHLIAVGRSPRNDVVVALNSVSKVHGYFVNEGDRWFFNDRHSTNGSWVNEQQIPPGERMAVEDGDELRIGPEVRFRFLLPQSLYKTVRD